MRSSLPLLFSFVQGILFPNNELFCSNFPHFPPQFSDVKTDFPSCSYWFSAHLWGMRSIYLPVSWPIHAYFRHPRDHGIGPSCCRGLKNKTFQSTFLAKLFFYILKRGFFCQHRNFLTGINSQKLDFFCLKPMKKKMFFWQPKDLEGLSSSHIFAGDRLRH